MEDAVGDVNRAVSTHLLDIILNRNRMLHHLNTIREYILMGQGDFIQILLDLVAIELDKPARDISPYVLQVGADGVRNRRCTIFLF